RRALLALALAACSPGSGDPQITSVDPPIASATLPTPIVIHGNNFFGTARTAVDDTAPSTFAQAYQVRVGTQPCAADTTSRLDEHTVQAVVPAGMAPGSYDLTLTTPAGKVALAQAAISVETAATLTAAASVGQSLVETGAQLGFTLTVTNQGSEPALAVTPSLVGLSGATVIDAPSAMDLSPGAVQPFAWVLRADVAGPLTLTAG